MSSLANSLQQQFPTETIQPYGKVIVIPNKDFLPEWEQQLKSQGHKVFMQSWNGESSFFIRIEKDHSVTEQPSSIVDAVDDRFGKHWTSMEVKKLKELLDMGLKPKEIASKLGRSKFAVIGKIDRMKLTQSVAGAAPAVTSMLAPTINIADNIFKEYLACVSELYPRYPNVCIFLLQEASNKILKEKHA